MKRRRHIGLRTRPGGGARGYLMMMPLSTHILNSAPRGLVSRVTALTSALQNMVNSLAVAALSTIVASRPSYHQATAQVNALAARTQASGYASPQGAFHLPAPIANLYATAFGDTLMVATAVTVAGILLSFSIRRRPAARSAAEATAIMVERPALEMAG